MTDIEKYLSTGAACGDAINCGVKSAVQFVEALCLPAVEEVGLLLRDKVRTWRINNIVSIVEKTQKIIDERGSTKSQQAHPRIAIKVIQEGSCIDDSNLQEMWAGLLVSSCNKDGSDEANLIFVNILRQLSSVQARIINYLVPESMRRFYSSKPTNSNPISLESSKLRGIAGLDDPALLERELKHLGSLGLISWQTIKNANQEMKYNITIDDVTLRFCACCAGYRSECYVEWTRLYNKAE